MKSGEILRALEIKYFLIERRILHFFSYFDKYYLRCRTKEFRTHQAYVARTIATCHYHQSSASSKIAMTVERDDTVEAPQAQFDQLDKSDFGWLHVKAILVAGIGYVLPAIP